MDARPLRFQYLAAGRLAAQAAPTYQAARLALTSEGDVMPVLPFTILWLWFRGVLAVVLLGGGLYLLYQWYDHLPRPYVSAEQHADAAARTPMPPTFRDRVALWRPGLDWETAALGGGLLLVLIASSGGMWVVLLGWPTGADDPKATRDGTVQRLTRPDGTVLQVECYGPPDAPPILVTHGWGVTSTQWYYLKRELAARFRLIVWDLPGCGYSTRPPNADYSLDKMARDLDAILTLVGTRPVVLLGHSLGGMLLLTFFRLFPEVLGARVCGLVLAHTTYTNPVRTTAKSTLYTALQKPVLEPLLRLTIWLSPLVWLLNLLSYLNGTAHLSTARQSFAGAATRGQVRFVTRFLLQISPAVLARGMFGMLRYDATATLNTIPIPVLIVAGDRDTSTTPAASTFMKAAIPGAQFTMLTPAKHQGVLEHHTPFAQTVAAFCAASSSAGKDTSGQQEPR
jgi:pimeloyl-ACP methyl ester carboxylesterase